MPLVRVVALGIGALALVSAFLSMILLAVYRPTVEYAYVQIVDLDREGTGPLFAAAEVCVLAALVALLPIGRSGHSSTRPGAP
jgi:hypothetical protein